VRKPKKKSPLPKSTMSLAQRMAAYQVAPIVGDQLDGSLPAETLDLFAGSPAALADGSGRCTCPGSSVITLIPPAVGLSSLQRDDLAGDNSLLSCSEPNLECGSASSGTLQDEA
jgi:hypothetical protein